MSRVAASTFEAALTATVRPAMVSVNRTRLVSLIGSNLLGQNAPAMAATEAEYEQMLAQNVAAMSGYYSDASALASRLTPWQQLMGGLSTTGPVATGPGTTLVMGTAFLQPTPSYVSRIDQLFIAPFHPGYLAQGLYTPEQYWPLTGLTSLTVGQSMVQSARVLNDAIMAQNGNPTLVFGYSQSASVATLEMRHLMTLPADQRPTADQLSFVLAANPNRPNGGFLERFHGLYIPILDLPFFGATPANAYPGRLPAVPAQPARRRQRRRRPVLHPLQLPGPHVRPGRHRCGAARVAGGHHDQIHPDPHPRSAAAEPAARHPLRGEPAGRPGAAGSAGARGVGL
ncbi:hypothetical protein AWC07_14095 [Mycobacterium gastri]|uniref:PE-PPE domain-containing protein n=1 Tax=Mycobacterium gastri TaxID=1777 RepID=A0A1X1V7Z4_MYCGS|nr:hypothetical protein AWC07_14095 [Mycobacterium gastri]